MHAHPDAAPVVACPCNPHPKTISKHLTPAFAHSCLGYRFNSPADRAHIKAQRGAIWAWIRGLGGNLIK
jgi:hypothetical protein